MTSWGDHRIDRFRLEPHGASFRATAERCFHGGENFRPVGIALAADGSLFVSDWVDKSYELHGKGRIWRIRAREAESLRPLDARHSRHRPAASSGPFVCTVDRCSSAMTAAAAARMRAWP